jgi:DNA adenine methylase
MTIQIDRPILKYYGGKFRLADWIISFFPEHLVYTECFGGAASVLLKKKPSKHEVYNDLNDEVVNLFRVVRDPETARKLRHMLKLTPYSRQSTWAYAMDIDWMDCEGMREAIPPAYTQWIGEAIFEQVKTKSYGIQKMHEL